MPRRPFRLDEDPAVRALVRNAPEQLFENPPPILFDEWQVKPTLWNGVRRQVDDRHGKGLYILTGSATPNDDITRRMASGTTPSNRDCATSLDTSYRVPLSVIEQGMTHS